MKFVSLCILAYKRPDMLMHCLDSLLETIDYPCEIIVNVDGEDNPDQQASQIAYHYFRQKKISKLINIGGQNRGVGKSFQNCFNIAEGNYIYKIDTDLLFKPKWLSTSINILDSNRDVGAVSLFDYRNYDPNDTRFYILEERIGCNIVSDFVSSIYGFKKERFSILKSFLKNASPDDGIHQMLGGKLAITKEDFVINSGFGKNSTYISFDEKDEPYKTPTYETPLIIS